MNAGGVPSRNRVAAAMSDGRRACGVHMTYVAAQAIEQIGGLGFDCLYLDMEHGEIDLADVTTACRCAAPFGLTIVVRVPSPDPWHIGACLDRGAQGIVVPNVETADQARAVVAACFRPPLGARANGAARSDGYRMSPVSIANGDTAHNAETTLSIQIESRRALDNLDAILSVPGITYFTIGRNDLCASLGHVRDDATPLPAFEETLAAVSKRIRAAGCLLKEDVMVLGRMRDFLVSGALAFLGDSPTV